MTLTGTNFGLSETLQIQENPVAANDVPSCVHTRIQFRAPAGQGLGREIKLTVGGQTAIGTLSYAVPQLLRLDPNEVSASGAIVTLIGLDFGLTGTVEVSGRTIPPENVLGCSHTSIQFRSPVAQGHEQSIQVRSGDQLSNPLTLRFQMPRPRQAWASSLWFWPSAGGALHSAATPPEPQQKSRRWSLTSLPL